MARKNPAVPATPIEAEVEAAKGKRSSPLSQADVPSYSLDSALRVPESIFDNYGSAPTKPIQVAKGMGVAPASSNFRGMCGAAIAYGLTKGGHNAPEIAVLPLARRILRPTEEGDDVAARREALLKPRVIKAFLTKYDGQTLPKEAIALNVLEHMGVPSDRTATVLELILEGAESVGMIHEIKGKRYLDLDARHAGTERTVQKLKDEAVDEDEEQESEASPPVRKAQTPVSSTNARRVFVTHGKNRAFLEPIKKLLAFGELEPVISAERQSVSQPVPDKVMNDMRGCGAAIIHVDAERKLLDQNANEHIVVNPNVLIEIGAAMALYGRRFVLLVREGVQLPSNLQGMYEVRYSGDTLDGEATIKLLEAIRDIKNHPLPTHEPEGDQ